MTLIDVAGVPYPFDLGFMQRALWACAAVGVFAPMIGVFLVQKRLSLIGDGIGHLAFAGVGAGLLAGVAPLWVALAAAIAGALVIEWFRGRRGTSGDVALAIVFYSGIALGVVLVSLGDGMNANLLGYLFGQPLTVRASEVEAIVALGAGVGLVVLVVRRAMFSVVTDEEWSVVAGLPVRGLNALLAVLSAVTVVAAMQIVGILLVAALMVLPVAAAQQVTRSFRATMSMATGIGAGSAIVGLGLARVGGLAAGGTIVLVAAATYVVLAAAVRLRRGATRGVAA
ncbi:MAG: metal ABC transporter permease [Actinomycetota bacterium]